jgi:hypothetical protein
VRQEQARGVELAKGSELERALALLITQIQRPNGKLVDLPNVKARSALHQQ